jgi:pyrroloquinoline quinone (PQQ) biosynthesis protein C
MENERKDEFLDELERIRGGFLNGRAFRERTRARSKEAIAESKRRRHQGGDSNHRFEGERYLNCTDKSVRRMQLRKLVDEGGQTTVGGKMPSHPELARWESYEFGLTPEEVFCLEKEDPLPQRLIVDGWWVNLMRTSHWAVAIGSSLVGEGEKRIPEIRKRLLEEIEILRREYTAMGIKDVERALAIRIEHAGVDVEHSEFGANVVRYHVNTPELKDQMRRAFILTIQGRGTDERF